MNKQHLPLEHLYKPADNYPEKAPLIILLHGYGSDENDLFSFSSELPANYAIISLKAPIAIQPYGNAWYSINFDTSNSKFNDTAEAIEARDLVSECIDKIIEKYPVIPEEITLLGFSQGTILSFAIALSYPKKIKNIIGLSGYISEDMLVDGYAENNFEHLNVYNSHGSVDQVIPVDWARKNQGFLHGLGIESTYSEFPVGHGVAPQNFYEFKEWLLKTDA